MDARHRVLLLPGSVVPATTAYGALLEVLGDRVDAIAKDLEVYAGDRPPADYSLANEVEGVTREADAHGFDRFHLVGYSGGGAAALCFAAANGRRLLSLALLEPAWAGNERTPEEDALMERFRALEGLPPDQFMAGFQRLQLAPGVEPPPRPDGPPPPWMAKRPAGIRAFLEAFTAAPWTSKRCARSIAPCTSHWVVAATPTTSLAWPSDWPGSSPTSRSRRSRSATISTRRTASSPNASPTH